MSNEEYIGSLEADNDRLKAELAETNRLLTAYQHDVVVWKRERDEAREMLDDIRDDLADINFDEVTHLVDVGVDGDESGDCIDECPGCALADVRAIVERETPREEPAAAGRTAHRCTLTTDNGNRCKKPADHIEHDCTPAEPAPTPPLELLFQVINDDGAVVDQFTEPLRLGKNVGGPRGILEGARCACGWDDGREHDPAEHQPRTP